MTASAAALRFFCVRFSPALASPASLAAGVHANLLSYFGVQLRSPTVAPALLLDSIARELTIFLALSLLPSCLRCLAARFHLLTAQPTELAADSQCTSLRAAESEVVTWLLAGIHDLLLLAGLFRHRAECRLLQAYWVWSPALGPHPVTCRLDGLSPSLLALSCFVSKTRSSVPSSGPQHKNSR